MCPLRILIGLCDPNLLNFILFIYLISKLGCVHCLYLVMLTFRMMWGASLSKYSGHFGDIKKAWWRLHFSAVFACRRHLRFANHLEWEVDSGCLKNIILMTHTQMVNDLKRKLLVWRYQLWLFWYYGLELSIPLNYNPVAFNFNDDII